MSSQRWVVAPAGRGGVDPRAVGLALEAAEEGLLRAYLDELGIEVVGGPGSEQLRALHRAHVLRFGHDTLWKARGRIPPLTEPDLARALVSGEGGGCVHTSSSFVWLLRRLGYDASLHRSRVQRWFDPAPAPRRDAHAVVLVRLDGVTWHCEVGLGNGPLDCVPLVEGTFAQPGGFTYALSRSHQPGRWLFHQDRRLAAIRVVDLEEEPASLEDFATGFVFDSTDPASPSLRHLAANRRRVDGVSVVNGRAWVEHGPAGRSMRRVASAAEWEQLLRDRIGLRLPALTEEERDELWEKAGRT